MKFTLKLFAADDVSVAGEYPGWRTLFWFTAQRYPRRRAGGFTCALRFRGWKPFGLIGMQGKEIVFPKWQPRPWEKEKAA